jgi:two-component system, OmpR family, phosphate regulon sensor histidine kinase PhoR
MKPRHVMQIAGVASLCLLLLISVATGTYFVTASLYSAIGSAPAPVVAQVIDVVLSVVFSVALAVATMAFINSRPHAKRRWMGIVEPILDAMERIARGDFQVRVAPTLGANTFVSELANSVNQMAVELSQMEQLRQEFISNVSHELQSPLTSIRGFAQALHDEQLSAEERSHYLSIIETESARLSRITDNMLKLASLESEHVEVHRRPYRLDKQIRGLILACEPQWTAKAIELEATLDEIVLSADEDMLSQVWSNLLHNSIKFTPARGRVSVEAHWRGDRVECRIVDTGEGISEDDQAHIFERFYKADTSRERSREGSGSGLGLAIAKKIVELHRGTIAVTSQPGAGATFSVVLPVILTVL